ncbi:MAG TPA: hypothetical protein PLZ84_02575 [Clostridia bacterium]|nr:hypothetical protein [Clostridia bacterium]
MKKILVVLILLMIAAVSCKAEDTAAKTEKEVNDELLQAVLWTEQNNMVLFNTAKDDESYIFTANRLDFMIPKCEGFLTTFENHAQNAALSEGLKKLCSDFRQGVSELLTNVYRPMLADMQQDNRKNIDLYYERSQEALEIILAIKELYIIK